MSARLLRTGDPVTIVCNGTRTAGFVLMASSNGVSVMLGFEGMIDGHVCRMPVLMDEDGSYHAIVTGTKVVIQGEQDGNTPHDRTH